MVQTDGSTALPAAGAAVHRVGRRELPGLAAGYPARAGRATGGGLALVAVSTSDGDPSVADTWLEPPRSRAASVGARRREPDVARRPGHGPAPHPPRRRPGRAATRAGRRHPRRPGRAGGLVGRARYSLGFPPVAAADGYRVLRASVASLFEADRAARRDGLPPYTGGAADADYAELNNREVMALAELACNEPAFLPAGTVAAPPFDDTLDGRGLGRFVYRVRSVDASGNAGPWSAVFPLVETRDVTAPAVPTLTSVLGGENRITTQWSAGTEPDLAEYRIWRADTREALDDVRRLEPTATVPADTHRFDDEGLPGLRTFYYRVAAVDAAGNVSPATPATAARVVDTTPPAPPAWMAAERTARGVRLAWRATEAGLTCVLQRRPLGGGVWRDVSGALEPDEPAGRLRASRPHARSRTRRTSTAYWRSDAAGNVNGDFDVRAVS